ncbi:hypothetical protein VIBNISO65_1450019 [Vibrio nigripulchritudo SO65]|nr:hypothetical protein VIBNIAM115_580001 [Vibrio nigripulchritudo AM115]CCN42217.1 hypothetical protein VIBNIFTn2_270001 [Vibrio nigripulchritudo FTn2]CCN65114.1 hypothetical protein VIBNIPon4_340001 [Vibrio nigripulchritudo POn4]CCN75867.1 hypothetical protein VIBNISO65_1450019 [Vibrio nigripulchritudo SO65]
MNNMCDLRGYILFRIKFARLAFLFNKNAISVLPTLNYSL